MNDYHPKAIAALSHVYKYPSKMANYIEWFVAILLASSFFRVMKNLIFSTNPTSKEVAKQITKTNAKKVSGNSSKSNENGQTNERLDTTATGKKEKKKGKNNA